MRMYSEKRVLELLREQRQNCNHEFNKRSVRKNNVWYVACEDVINAEQPKLDSSTDYYGFDKVEKSGSDFTFHIFNHIIQYKVTTGMHPNSCYNLGTFRSYFKFDDSEWFIPYGGFNLLQVVDMIKICNHENQLISLMELLAATKNN